MQAVYCVMVTGTFLLQLKKHTTLHHFNYNVFFRPMHGPRFCHRKLNVYQYSRDQISMIIDTTNVQLSPEGDRFLQNSSAKLEI